MSSATVRASYLGQGFDMSIHTALKSPYCTPVYTFSASLVLLIQFIEQPYMLESYLYEANELV